MTKRKLYTDTASYNIDGAYKSISGVYGHVDGTGEFPATLRIYGDGYSILEIDMKPGDAGIPFSVDISNISQLKLEFTRNHSCDYAIAEVILSQEEVAKPPYDSQQQNSYKGHLGFDVPSYQSNSYVKPVESVLMGGKEFRYGIRCYGTNTDTASYNLNKSYKRISGVYGHVDGTKDNPATLKFYGDGNLVKEIEMKSNDFGINFDVDVTDVSQLTIEFTRTDSCDYAIAEVVLMQNEASITTSDSSMPRGEYMGYLGFDVPACQSNNYVKSIESVFIGGKNYDHAIRCYGTNTDTASYNLNKEYSLISGVYGHVDGTNDNPATLKFYGDGKLIKEIAMKSNDFGIDFDVDVADVSQLTIEFTRTDSCDYAIARVRLNPSPFGRHFENQVLKIKAVL